MYVRLLFLPASRFVFPLAFSIPISIYLAICPVGFAMDTEKINEYKEQESCSSLISVAAAGVNCPISCILENLRTDLSRYSHSSTQSRECVGVFAVSRRNNGWKCDTPVTKTHRHRTCLSTSSSVRGAENRRCRCFDCVEANLLAEDSKSTTAVLLDWRPHSLSTRMFAFSAQALKNHSRVQYSE